MSTPIYATPTYTRSTPPSSLTKLNIQSIPISLDEPAAQGITIQPPTAILEDSKLPQPLHQPFTTKPAAPALESTPQSLAEGAPLNRSPGSATGSGTNIISPSTRHSLVRQLSPDLPTKDTLYLFSNFASYMRSPNEGADGIVGNEDFRDTVRLLEFARGLVAQRNSNVHILHLKYRFQSPLENVTTSSYSAGDPQFTTHTEGKKGSGNPVPQPFSVARDPVLKVDYQENGVFDPLPAQAVFDHISKACYPPPRLIVVSFVNSIVIQNHIAQLSTWALTSSPPCYVFSPLETRLRVTLPIQVALHHAIPMSMYAHPDPGPSPYKPSPTRSIGGGVLPKGRHESPVHDASSSGGRGLRRRHSEQSLPQTQQSSVRSYPRDPIASLTIISTPNHAQSQSRPSTSSGIPNPSLRDTLPPSTSSPQSQPHRQPPPLPQSDRLPLWALAPGMNVLQGSTSASIGIKLGDFSSLNLVNNDHENINSLGKALVGHRSRMNHHAGEVWIDSSPLKSSSRMILAPPLVKPPSRPSTPASRIMDDTGSDNRSIRSFTSHRFQPYPHPNGHPNGYQHQFPDQKYRQYQEHQQYQDEQNHLSPPEQFSPPNLFQSSKSKSSHSHAGQFPRLARIPHWKRGRKELPEDVLEDMGKGLEVEGVVEGMRNLGLWDLEHGLHADRARRESDDPGGVLMGSLRS